MSKSETARISGVWEFQGNAAQLVLDIQSEKIKQTGKRPGKQRVIQKLLCELYNERNKCKGDC